MNANKFLQPYFLYLLTIFTAGFIFIVWGLSQFPLMEPKSSLYLILALAVFAEIAATTVSVSEQGITFEVGTAVSMALIPLYGPGAAVVSAAACTVALWAIHPSNRTTWKKNWEQLAFNVGMHSMAIIIAGFVLLNIQQVIGSETFIGQIIPWLVAAVLYDQLNFWMLMVIIRLKQGPSVHPLEIWRENLWAIPINIMILSVGGGVLALAVTQLGVTGIVVFFLPIILSAYAFHVYARQMREHADNLENMVAERTSALKKVMQEKDAFLAVLTHDMKAPLTSIHLYATMLKDYPHILEKKPHMIDTVLRSQEALTDIVNNILDLESLQENGQVPMKMGNFSFGSLAKEVIELFRVQAERKSIDLQFVDTPAPIQVHADQRHMERVLSNLISNAIKYTPNNGRVCLRLRATQQTLFFQIEDNGLGIPEDELEFIFDRFRRVHSHKNLVSGTGLGLAITKALVEAHEGTISVESQESVGSTFSIELPIVVTESPFLNKKKDARIMQNSAH